MHATATPKLVDQQPAFLAVLATLLFAAGIALGAALPGLDLKIGPSAAVTAPDTSYNAVEGIRAQFGVTPDTSYDQVESLRAKAGMTVVTEFDVLHAARAKAALRGFPSQRAQRALVTASDTQAEPDSRYGSGIR